MDEDDEKEEVESRLLLLPELLIADIAPLERVNGAVSCWNRRCREGKSAPGVG